MTIRVHLQPDPRHKLRLESGQQMATRLRDRGVDVAP